MLTQIGANGPPPPPPTGFRIMMPPAPGNSSAVLISWLSTGSDYRIRMSSQLPQVVATDETGGQEVLETAPALCVRWMPAAQAEPVARWIERSFSGIGELAYESRRQSLPAFGSGARVFAAPGLCSAMPVPAAEAVACFVQPSIADQGMAGAFATALPSTTSLAVVTDSTPPELCGLMPSMAAEPVARFVASGFVGSVAGLRRNVVLGLFGRPGGLPYVQPALYTSWMSSPAAEPVARIVQTSMAEQIIRTAAIAEPEFTVTAELEPLPVHDAGFNPPAVCERWMPAAAEPAWSFLASATAAEVSGPIVQASPLLSAAVAGPYMPVATALRAVPKAQPVMAGVWPHVADTPIVSMAAAIGLCLPEIADALVSRQSPIEAAAAAGLIAEPVEEFVAPSYALLPLIVAATVAAPEIAALSAGIPAPAAAAACAGLEAEAVETLVAASSAGPMISAAPVRLQAFQIGRSEECVVPGLDQPRIAATAAAPAPASGKVLELRPISTIRVTVPEPQHERTAASIPFVGPIALEYHIQRTGSTAFARPEWKSPRFEPLAPEFRMRPVLEKLADVVKPKTKPAGVFAMPAPKPSRTHSPAMDYALRAAAAVLIITTLWFGAGTLKNGRRQVARQEESFTAPNHTLTADSQTGNTKAAESKGGPVNWMRRTLANRASVQVGDDFQRGMKNWSADAKQYPAGWQHNADGYMQTGALAIFKPTVTFTDYRLEFFGQIENKSVGWAVRARDEKNYHAMKFTVIEAGLRPLIAMVHYNVVDGKPGRKIQTPLNVMVHNNRPIQVAVNVRGTHFVTSIDGEEVDTFSDDLLASGGVGFFSEAGERARLYWTKVTKNDDWLGHMCAYLSGESSATAEFRLPSAPGETPAPWSPVGGDNPALAAAWIGLPYLKRTQTRRERRCTR